MQVSAGLAALIERVQAREEERVARVRERERAALRARGLRVLTDREALGMWDGDELLTELDRRARRCAPASGPAGR
ncbi:hypothetical protein ABZW02_20335 [Streptomyces sp. NPDC005180]|uniref:hypothetical protein n=1 Tax=Streptomyces sp. NPDC005180 TaxID=3156868 RepID=UPI0033BF7C08